MSDTEAVAGGFAGDPAQALTAAATGGCCGNSAPSTIPPADASGACCGTAAEAQVEGSCCGGAAKAESVASGQGCCS